MQLSSLLKLAFLNFGTLDSHTALALSLAALLLIANLPYSGSDSDNFKLYLEMPSVERCVRVGCQLGRPASEALFFRVTEYKSTACHCARSSACNKSYSGIRLVTIQSKPSDHDAEGSGAVGLWPPPKAPQRQVLLLR